MSDIKLKVKNGIQWSFLSTVSQIILQFAFLSILSRLLEPKAFGIAVLANLIITFLFMFSEMGLEAGIVRQQDLSVKHVSSGYFLTFLLVIFTGGILVSSAHITASFFNIPELKNVLQLLSITLLFKGLSSIPKALLQRDMDFKKLFYVNFFSFLIGYGLIGIVLAYNNFGYWSLVIASLSQDVISFLILSYYSPRINKIAFHKQEILELLHFSGGYTISRFLVTIASQASFLLIGKLLGPFSLGLYDRAYRVASLPDKLLNSINMVSYPLFSSIQNHKKKIADLVINNLNLVFLISIPISVLIIILSEEIVLVILGEKWIEAVPLLKVIVLMMPLSIAIQVSDTMIRALGAVYKNSFIKFIFVLLMSTFGYIGHFWGLKGVILGINLAYLIYFILMLYFTSDLIEVSKRGLLKCFIPGLKLSVVLVITLFPVVVICRMLNYPLFTLVVPPFISFFSIIILFLRYPKILGEECFKINQLLVENYIRPAFGRFKIANNIYENFTNLKPKTSSYRN